MKGGLPPGAPGGVDKKVGVLGKENYFVGLLPVELPPVAELSLDELF